METPTFSFKGYLPNGFPVNVVVPITDDSMGACAYAVAFTNQLLADGFTLDAPGLEAGEEREVIVTVMRRAKPADDTPIIDFYTEWGAGTDEPFGTYKYQHIYMDKDKPELLADFLKFSGFKRIEDIPLYDAQTPLKRTFGKKHAKETAVPTPFKIVKKQGAEKLASDGKTYKPWEFVRFEAITPTAPATPPASQPATAQASEPPRVAFTEPSISNELITIVQVVKGDSVQAANDNYRGYTYHATAKFTDPDNVTSTFLLKLWPEDVNAIKKAGYPFPDAGGDCKIPVVAVVLADGTLRINRDALTSAAAGVVPEGQYKPDWTIIYSKVKALYDNQKHMGNSVQALFKEGAFKGCRSDADAIAVIVAHKNGFAEGTPA